MSPSSTTGIGLSANNFLTGSGIFPSSETVELMLRRLREILVYQLLQNLTGEKILYMVDKRLKILYRVEKIKKVDFQGCICFAYFI